MDVREKRNVTGDIVYLLRCAIRQEAPDRERVEAMNLELVYEEAERHKLAAAVGMALELAGVVNGRFVQAVAMAQRKAALLDADKAAVLERLEAAGIWHMPLKGAILKDLYPRFGMREMSDIDILFDKSRAEDVKGIMESLGFTIKSYGKRNDDDYMKPPVSNFEMHKDLFLNAFHPELHRYYVNIKEKLIPDAEGRFSYHFTDEDFYLYVIAHEHAHYSSGGTGLRSLLDTYVYLKDKSLDMEYVRREAEKIGIAEFEPKNRRLSFHLFDGEALSDDDQAMLDYIVSSGAYGTTVNHANNEIRQKGRLGYFFSKLSFSPEKLAVLYPVLKKAPFLYPVFWVLRLLRGLFQYNQIVMTELKAILSKKKHE